MTTLAAHDTTRRVAQPPPPPVSGHRAGVDPARAQDSLTTLFEAIDALSGPTLRDAALGIYNTNGLTDKDKAFAAYLVATGWAKIDSSSTSICDWARRAVNLEPTSRGYDALRRQACGS